MTARIYRPAKTAMQSGTAKTKEWMLDYEPEEPREIDPLMGWTSSGDMRQQVRLRFDTAEEATAYCRAPRHCLSGIRDRAPRASHDLVFRQFLLQAPGSLDALGSLEALTPAVRGQSIGCRKWLAAQRAAPARPAIDAISRKKLPFVMLLQKPPR